MSTTITAQIKAWAAPGLRALGYAVVTLAWSVIGFSVLIAGASIISSLLVFVVGLPVWLGFVHAVRWTTGIDRRLAGWQLGAPVRAHYRRPAGRGFWAAVRAAGSDPQTWRELAWLGLASIGGFAGSLALLTGALLVLAWISLPAWYWAVSDPAAHAGLTNVGMTVVDTPAKAVVVSAVGLALVPAVLLLARGCATKHAALAARVLGAGA